jgi:hypothetical protein
VDASRVNVESRAAQLQAEIEEAQLRVEEANRRAARILELSRKARKGQATAEELAELDRLEESGGGTT